MQITGRFTLAVLTVVAVARLHSFAVGIQSVKKGSMGNGTPYGMGYAPWTQYEIYQAATDCACHYYGNRNTGNQWWDKCQDCKFDGLQCKSPEWRISGDEITYYCQKKCGASGADTN
ncbi:hypothetical protein CCHL11_05115 [Colletotrichum chlorophyti]|uniref:Uncharacterized protein n=1 Tax=Colletotrichum chlorophyti TaxID=708187 RepID=A0A1Q8S259_9PEZI|nr:hypothetical protein CCHL11_05115 [Colletotrichum chlorophyti]